MLQRFSTILLFIILLQVPAFAAGDSLQLRHFDISNGLPTNNVYSLIQDRNGYLWFATDNGVVKYNGYTFKTYNTRDGLPSNDIFMAYEDKKGRIWLHTLAYKFGYMYNGVYTPLSYTPPDKLFNVHLIADNGEYVFFATMHNGIFSLCVLKNDVLFFVPLFTPYGNKPSKKEDFLMFFDLTRDCKIWGFGYSGEVYYYDLLRPYEKYRLVRKFATPQYPTRSTIARNNNSRAFITNAGYFSQHQLRSNTLFTTDLNTGRYWSRELNNAPQEFIFTSYSGDAIHDPNANTVITNAYIYQLDSTFRFTGREDARPITQGESQISYRLKDHLHNTWYTTNSQGVYCKQFVPHFLKASTAYTGVNSNARYMGTSTTGAIYWWNKNTMELASIDSAGRMEKTQNPPSLFVKGMIPLNDSLDLMATTMGMFTFNPRTKQQINVTDGKTKAMYYLDRERMSLINDTVRRSYLGNHYAIARISDSELFSVNTIGANFFRHNEDSFIVHNVNHERFSSILLDTFNHTVWAYNQQKICIYDPAKNTQVVFGPEQLTLTGLHNISNIEMDRFGNIYAGDDEKIIVFNRYQHKLYTLRCNFNLANVDFHLFHDMLLLEGKFGIAFTRILGPASIGDFKLVPNINYMYYNKVFDFVVTKYGGIQLNTDKGFYTFNLSDVDSAAPVFKADNPTLGMLEMKFPYEKKVRDNDTFIIPQATEKIELDAINYFGEGTPSFKYYIASYNDKWQQSDGEILLGKLKPGEYYKVSCYVTDDMWQGRRMSFYLYRSPYWWQTARWISIIWITIVGVAVSIILLVVLLTRNIVARSNEKKQMTTELELRALYAQINPHFIFNTLSGALFFINKKRFDDAYVHVSKFSRLLRAYLKSSQDRYVILDEEIQMLRNYIELQQIRFEEKFEYRIELDNKVPAKSIQIPSLLLQPLVENAINHGLFHREKGGVLLLSFKQGRRNDELICTIEDNGIGRAAAKNINRANASKHDSYGTKLTQQLIDIFREYEHMNIYLSYTDKNEPDTGTIVTLTIKNVKYVA